jgi:hypothetical protein
MFDARPGARAALLALVVCLLAPLTLLAIRAFATDGRTRSAARHALYERDRPRAQSVATRVVSRTKGDRVEVYRGLGTWIDVYDVAWRHPEGAVRKMAHEGIRTLYLQTSNFSRPSPFVFPDRVGRFLDAAHGRGLRVVAWYLPGFGDLPRDLHRSLAAVGYRSHHGNTFDSFAVDIESQAVGRSSTRTRRLLTYTARLRRVVGADYPLGAIIPSPRNLDVRTTWWPGFPFRAVAREYDVILPMNYFTYSVRGSDGARSFTVQNIGIIRRETGDPAVPIHVIGGIGASVSETRGFADALRERHVIGASYYTFPITPSHDWELLRRAATAAGGPAAP